eukprot:g10949.t1
MDPNQRKTLEIAYESINMAGIDMPSLKRSPQHIGCFVGVSGSEWGMVPHPADAAGCGGAEAIISNRVNFSLNLKGASQTINTACSAGLFCTSSPPSPRTVAMDEEDDPHDGPGLIKLDMQQFGKGTMEDPLRHAVGMRTAQDHGPDSLSQEIEQVEAAIWEKERELKDGTPRDLRQHLIALKAQVCRPQEQEMEEEEDEQQGLEEAVRRYEKAAGLLRYVECTRPDWKNDDGSYKGIEDDFLRVDETALQGQSVGAQEATELVTSCYLRLGRFPGMTGQNIALASQKLGKFDDMKKACDEVLNKVNPESVKALYRRAQARIGPASAGPTERQAAIQEGCSAKLAPGDKEVRTLLTKLKADKKKQELEDKSTFGGLFQRGEVVKDATHTGKLYLKYKDFDPLEGSICCGTQLAYSPFGFLSCCGGGMLSFQGRCFTYDRSADGYLRGEGVSGIYLQRNEYSNKAELLSW